MPGCLRRSSGPASGCRRPGTAPRDDPAFTPQVQALLLTMCTSRDTAMLSYPTWRALRAVSPTMSWSCSSALPASTASCRLSAVRLRCRPAVGDQTVPYAVGCFGFMDLGLDERVCVDWREPRDRPGDRQPARRRGARVLMVARRGAVAQAAEICAEWLAADVTAPDCAARIIATAAIRSAGSTCCSTTRGRHATSRLTS